MGKFLDGATESHWVGFPLDYQRLLSWYGFHEENGLRNSSKVFPLFQDCYKSIQSIYSICAPDYTHQSAICAHFERHLPPSLWTMVLQTKESV